jgi:hypothetical protein
MSIIYGSCPYILQNIKEWEPLERGQWTFTIRLQKKCTTSQGTKILSTTELMWRLVTKT